MSGGLTSPDRVYFPQAGFTKQDYRDYLMSVAGRILPHVKRRPLSLVRCPDDIEAECFFQKHHAKGMPDGFRPVEIEESGGRSRDYLYIEDEDGLEACAQFGALELHPWGAALDDLEHPERLVFDLDPDVGYDFEDLKDTARNIRDLLRTAGLAAYALLTGGKGIHVIAPLDGSSDWDAVKVFAHGLARGLEVSDPGRYVASASKQKREGRIFVDWLRNQRGATAIAPFSIRARKGPPVATPVRWDELSGIASPAAYDLRSLPRRLSALKDDPWADYFDAAAPLREGALNWARGFL